MRIDSSTSDSLFANLKAGSASSNPNEAADAFASALDRTKSGSAGADGPEDSAGVNYDFAHMTRKELADLINEKIRSGEMSLDGSESLMAMTMKMPVNGPFTGLDDQEEVNFIDKAQGGIAWAQQHNDTALAARLNATLDLMHRFSTQDQPAAS